MKPAAAQHAISPSTSAIRLIMPVHYHAELGLGRNPDTLGFRGAHGLPGTGWHIGASYRNYAGLRTMPDPERKRSRCAVWHNNPAARLFFKLTIRPRSALDPAGFAKTDLQARGCGRIRKQDG